ncbi:hypothetical protein B5X24_HaOG201830 [Helicoverpa armigera]|nr:hypothetical protein B5X24_HaOG201830 [Helicoverpa armigera]
MLPIAETDESATALTSMNARHRRTRDRVVTAEMRAVRRRRGWTVVGSETSGGAADKRRPGEAMVAVLRRRRQSQSVGTRGHTRLPPRAHAARTPAPRPSQRTRVKPREND